MKPLYFELKCKDCSEPIGYYPYTDRNEAVILFSNKFICGSCRQQIEERNKK